MRSVTKAFCSHNWINFYRFLKKVSKDKILKKVSNDEILKKVSKDELFKKVFKDEILKKVSKNKILKKGWVFKELFSKDEIGDKSKETAADGKLQQVKDIYNNICQYYGDQHGDHMVIKLFLCHKIIIKVILTGDIFRAALTLFLLLAICWLQRFFHQA